jgi:hypothetical protein
MFVACQDRENQNHDVPYLVGVVVAMDAADGCILKKPEQREIVNGIRFDSGDYIIGVKW